MPTDVIHIYVKFHLNASTKCGDIALREIGVNKRTNGWTDGLPDGQPKYMMLSACYCWRMQNKPLRTAAWVKQTVLLKDAENAHTIKCNKAGNMLYTHGTTCHTMPDQIYCTIIHLFSTRTYPSAQKIVYSLLNRKHSRSLIDRLETTDLNDRHFLISALYKDCYWLLF